MVRNTSLVASKCRNYHGFTLVKRPALSKRAFTLVELLVVIGIIALLISILLPALSRARQAAVMVKSLANLRQLGLGLELYKNEYKGAFPVAAWPSVPSAPRMRWADYLFPLIRSTEVFMSPALDDNERARMKKPFAHTCDPITGATLSSTVYWGGYGYNYQYLGNGRHNLAGASTIPTNNAPFHARAKDIRASAETIAFSDTRGSEDGFAVGEGVYVIDPPLQSLNFGSRGSRKSLNNPAGTGNYGYMGGNDGEDAKTSIKRARPIERMQKKVAVAFVDGHAEALTWQQMDDKNGDGVYDNGYWNGRADTNPSVR